MNKIKGFRLAPDTIKELEKMKGKCSWDYLFCNLIAVKKGNHPDNKEKKHLRKVSNIFDLI